MGLACGIDVGGTKIAGAVVDDHGKIVEHQRVESPATEVEAIEDAIVELVSDLRTRHEFDCVGLGAAGYVDASRARVIFAPNLAWRDFDLKSEIEERINLRVAIENDANAAAWGEFRFGGGEDIDDLLMVTVGTGVGGGIVMDGDLQRGAFGFAAEIGHLRVVPEGRECGCGNLGCFEQYASGSALLRSVREAVEMRAPEAAEVLRLADGDPSAISGPMVTTAAQDGDAFAIEKLAELGDWLGQGVASLVTVLDPAVIVVGGGVSEAGDLLLDPMRASFFAHLAVRGHRPVAEIRPAQLGNKAGVIGAADLARH